MLKFIGLTGLAGAGKDTFALALQRALISKGIVTEITSWADPIRDIAAHLGFKPYDREAKEVVKAFVLDDFTESLQVAIDWMFSDTMHEDKRAELYAFTVDALDQYVHEDTLYVSPRQFMQLLGTEAGRRIDRDLWIKRAMADYECRDVVVLVPDTRFNNEVGSCQLVVNVMRPGVVPVSSHSSEQLAAALLDYRSDYYHGTRLVQVYNGHRIEDLEDAANEIAAYVLHRRAAATK